MISPTPESQKTLFCKLDWFPRPPPPSLAPLPSLVLLLPYSSQAPLHHLPMPPRRRLLGSLPVSPPHCPQPVSQLTPPPHHRRLVRPLSNPWSPPPSFAVAPIPVVLFHGGRPASAAENKMRKLKEKYTGAKGIRNSVLHDSS